LERFRVTLSRAVKDKGLEILKHEQVVVLEEARMPGHLIGYRVKVGAGIFGPYQSLRPAQTKACEQIGYLVLNGWEVRAVVIGRINKRKGDGK